MIFYDFRAGLNQQECFNRIKGAFGDDAPSIRTIYSWFAEFKRGRARVSDEPREGRPNTAVVPENIDAVREWIKTDRHVTYKQIVASLGIGMTATQTILHDQLGVRKVCSRWIPHLLPDDQKKNRVIWCKQMLQKYSNGTSKAVYDIVTGDETWIYSYEPETKQQSTVWVFEGENNPTKVVRSRSVSKKMIACFFSKTGHVATVALEDRRTVNAEWYSTICLPEVIDEWRKTNRKRRLILHQDNASAHTAGSTIAFLKEKNVDLMSHTPYSPDLSPCDFFLFPKVKNLMRGQRFRTPEEAVEAFRQHVLAIPQTDWQKCYDDWFHRMNKCINVEGEYFEKQ